MRTFVPADYASVKFTPPCLTVTQHGQPPIVCPLQEGGSLFAGSAASCGIQITGDQVAQFHCMFSLTQGRLWVQDCNTGGEIFINGQPIDCETVLNHGDEVTIGAHKIVAILAHFGMPSNPSISSPMDAAPAEPRAAESRGTPDAPADAAEHDPSLTPDTREYLDQLIHELSDEAEQAAEAQPTVDAEPAEHDVPPAFERGYQTVDFREEENDLLREEIAHLQRELAERDAALERYRDTPALLDPRETQGDDENVLRLVQRLEELLEELQKSDGRILALEELLRVSEEAKRAEHDEREQLDSWVGEIEQRLAQREAEMEAEVVRLKSRNEELQAQLQQNETHIRTMVKTVSAPAALPQKAQEVVQGLRDRSEDLARRLQAAEAESQRLRDELKTQTETSEEALRVLEQKLVHHELSASRERAEIARSRAELERTRDDIERGLHDGDLNETDTRFAAMRQHLRELHEQEARVREERRQRSLGGRIASLLSRVGNR